MTAPRQSPEASPSTRNPSAHVATDPDSATRTSWDTEEAIQQHRSSDPRFIRSPVSETRGLSPPTVTLESLGYSRGSPSFRARGRDQEHSRHDEPGSPKQREQTQSDDSSTAEDSKGKARAASPLQQSSSSSLPERASKKRALETLNNESGATKKMLLSAQTNTTKKGSMAGTNSQQTSEKTADPQFNALSEPRPRSLKIHGATIHQYAFVGNKGQPEPQRERILVPSSNKWEKKGPWRPLPEPQWVSKAEPHSSLPKSTTSTDFSPATRSQSPKWDKDKFDEHVIKHCNETWFKELFGEGKEGKENYLRESKLFAQIPATESLVSRYKVVCLQDITKRHPTKNPELVTLSREEIQNIGAKDLLLYSYKNNMLLVLHEPSGRIHTFISPRDAEGYVKRTLKKRGE